jgi:hypothetical protein
MEGGVKGVGSRFRPMTNHMENRMPENDSRPLGCGHNPLRRHSGPHRPCAGGAVVWQLQAASHTGCSGVGSRFRPTTDHMGNRMPENDSRPLGSSPG